VSCLHMRWSHICWFLDELTLHELCLPQGCAYTSCAFTRWRVTFVWRGYLRGAVEGVIFISISLAVGTET